MAFVVSAFTNAQIRSFELTPPHFQEAVWTLFESLVLKGTFGADGTQIECLLN